MTLRTKATVAALLMCAAGISGCASLGGASDLSQATPQGRPTVPLAKGKNIYVLVHGAWGGGYHYGMVDDMLTAHGHKVYRPTFTGQGEHYNLSNPDIDLTTHINDVVNVVLWEDLHDIVLVGHSYGGVVITGIADRVPDRIKHVVYLDAFLPENGQGLNTAGRGGGGRGPTSGPGGRGPTSGPGGRGARRGGGANVPPGFRGLGNFDPTRPPPFDVPQSEKTFSETLSLKNQDKVAKIPHWYILTVDPGRQPAQDMFYSHYQRAEAHGWKLFTMEGDHNIMVSHPRELVELLEKVP